MSTILLAFKEGELSAEHLAQIQTLVPDKRLLVTQDRAEIEAVLDDIEISVCSFPTDLLSQAPNLRWHQAWGAGVDWVLRYPELVEADLIITNASGVHAIPISEHIMAFLLAFARNIPDQVHNQAHGKWRSPRHNSIFELAGKKMLLIGVGAIGAHTAPMAAAFGITVTGIRRNPEKSIPGIAAMYGPERLHECLPNADFVVLTVPLTDETKGMISEAELRLMKPNAYIINIGRGGTIQQNVMIRALQEGWIAGAGLDVTDPEPLPESSPLWSMENVIITAHYSGRTPNYTERALAIFLDNLERYVAGKPLVNVVDKRLGY